MFNPFWNREENRPRALWRLALQVGLLFVLETVAGVLLVAISSSSNALDLSDPLALWRNPLISLLALVGIFLANVLSVWLAGKWFDHRSLRDFGFHFDRGWWLNLGFGLLLGAFLMLLIFLAELEAGWVQVTGNFLSAVPGLPFGWLALQGVAFYIAVGIQEELVFRGYWLRNLAEGFHFKGSGIPHSLHISPHLAILLGYLLSSIVFGVSHALNSNATVTSTLNVMLGGLFLGMGYVLTGELAVPIGVHIAWNYFEGYVFGFPVSGTSSAGSFIAIHQAGPAIWTGGAFGPEAGLVGIGAILLGCLLIYLWIRWQSGQAALHGRLAIYFPPAARPAAGQPEHGTS